MINLCETLDLFCLGTMDANILNFRGIGQSYTHLQTWTCVHYTIRVFSFPYQEQVLWHIDGENRTRYSVKTLCEMTILPFLFEPDKARQNPLPPSFSLCFLKLLLVDICGLLSHKFAQSKIGQN